jgi:hypothetical protein
MSDFEQISADSWVLGPTVEVKRRARLLQSPGFEHLVAELNHTSQIERVQYQGVPGNQLVGHRCIVVLRAESELLDRFFNSTSEYRAQYLAHPNTGDKANRLVIDTLYTKVVHALAEQSGKMERKFAEASLAHAWAKVWLHQGLWLRQAKREHRLLHVPTWRSELALGDKRRRKLVRWGSLIPAQESRLLLKGGYVRDDTELEVGKPPFRRAQELHELGFT